MNIVSKLSIRRIINSFFEIDIEYDYDFKNLNIS